MAHGEKGKNKLVNCLLDTGSELSLIRSDVADELDLQGPTRAMTVKGVNGLHGLELSFPSLCDDLVATPTPWFCTDKIPSLPSNEITPGRVQIDIIIGLDAYFQVLGQCVRRGSSNDPVAIETIFGWIVCGPTTRQAANRDRRSSESTLETILGSGGPWNSSSD
ncbi:hypothetical protein T03_9993 [Trichinella britovi]|uniref:Peptidase A2 domain-containing protein n=1 Tax=Trichinella britovi TaxID=45882 RepID=A0A0V1AYG5_TRIBR|nr:hypothetical protein T03_17234 [Trichinella britovi]KRY41471.1 hypothetical protein T03_9993 [Trichinella britovi]